jgi:hypothetical protein
MHRNLANLESGVNRVIIPYVVGITYSNTTVLPKFPITANAFETTNNQANQDVNNGFAAIFNSTGNKLLYSSFIHGSSGAPPSRLALSPNCTGTTNCVIYFSGSTTNTNKLSQNSRPR